MGQDIRLGTLGQRRDAVGEGLAALLDGPGALQRPPTRSLYIHMPFCIHKCHYCDFYSFVDTRDQQEAFTNRLVREIEWLAQFTSTRGGLSTSAQTPVSTIFVGGGTPSMLRTNLWERVLAALDRHLNLEDIRAGRGEFTVECNPESATPELLTLLKAGGVDRVSVGAQSFNQRHLDTLERRHNPANVARALDAARDAGISRRNVDLIFAIPGQTTAEWADDLDTALALGTTHISCYNLTYEPNTAMTKRLAMGEFKPVDEDVEIEMYEHTVGRLAAAGLDRYEVSNFAVPGEECLHNLAYWRQEQWLAAGPSASGHAWASDDRDRGSFRWKNVPRLGEYLGIAGTDQPACSPVVDVEHPDPLRLVRERIMMGLRLREGIEAPSVLGVVEAIAPDRLGRLMAQVRRDEADGVLEIMPTGQRWRLTDAGMLLGDEVAGRLMRIIAG